MLFLEKENAHPRDTRIKFFEKGHKYEIDGEGGYTSVTTFNIINLKILIQIK